MPDHTRMHNPPQPGNAPGWTDAFAALPLETPDGGAWQRLQRARVPRARRPTRWPAWMAAAAVLALAAVLPWQLMRTDNATTPEAVAATPAPANRAATQQLAAAASVQQPIVDRQSPATSNNPASAETASATPAPILIASNVREPRTASTRSSSARVQPAETSLQRDIASTNAPTESVAEAPARPWPKPAVPELERLYAESAQLEALVALARDDRVATGAAATLTSAYDAQVASIDASLREPGVDPGQREALWQQRVDALRQLAGFESTQRALAAQGERYDAALVSID